MQYFQFRILKYANQVFESAVVETTIKQRGDIYKRVVGRTIDEYSSKHKN
jgi:hypothetical protein